MSSILSIQNLESGYGKKQVLFDISLEVGKGEIVALIGPNGAGKSTVIKTIFGLVPAWSGSMSFNSVPIAKVSPATNVQEGIVYAPQGNRVFQDLTIRENLETGCYRMPRKEALKRISEVLELFPILQERLSLDAGNLSGGEQQMLALARVLLNRPKLMLLDEPSVGLSPNLVQMVLSKIAELSNSQGISILIVEQKVREVLQICERVYSMKLGRVSFTGKPGELTSDPAQLRSLFL